MGCRTVAVTGNYKDGQGGELAQMVDVAIVVPTTSMERIEDMQLIINHIVKKRPKPITGCDTMLPPHRESADRLPLELLDLPNGNDLGWKNLISTRWRNQRRSENYVNSRTEVELLPHAGKAIGNLRRAGYRIVGNESITYR